MPRKKHGEFKYDKGEPHQGQCVAYKRVSTRKQGDSGLGLAAQGDTINKYLNGGDWTIIAEFEEVESGRKSDEERPELQKALQLCRKTGATLIVARLDRLSRNVSFTSALMESGVDFICCDMPQANRFTIHVLAAAAEQEAALGSKRTIAGLQALRERSPGIKLGNPHIEDLGDIGRNANSAKAQRHAEQIYPIIQRIKRMGPEFQTYRGIARELNNRNDVKTRQSTARAILKGKAKKFSAQQVKNIIKRIEGEGK